MPDPDWAAIRRAFAAVVNMAPEEIEDWLATEESRKVGWTRPGEAESVGRASARHIVRILRTAEPALGDEDYRHMRKVVGFVRRHRAQEPANIVTSRWRYSLMNWGHDPLKDDRRAGAMKKGYCDNIEAVALANPDFRRVLYTAKHLQLVVMALPVGCDIGSEIHEDRDQFFRIEEGEGEIWIDGVANKVSDDFVAIVPAGARHNVVNTGDKPLKLYTIYAPPEHKDKVVHKTKEQAQADHDNDEWDGETTE